MRCTRAGGRLVTCGATTGFEAATDLRYVWTRELATSSAPTAGAAMTSTAVVVERVRTGKPRAGDPRRLPARRGREAVAEFEERRAFGKVIVVPDGAA